MSTEIKFRILLFFSLLCLVGFSTQAYLLYDLKKDRTSTDLVDNTIPESILEKLEAEIAKPDRLYDGTNGSVFGYGLNSDPITAMQSMQSQVDQLFDSMFGRPRPTNRPFWSQTLTGMSSQPEIVVEEKSDSFVVTLVKHPEQNIELQSELEDNVLILAGLVRAGNRQGQSGSFFSSSSISQFSRSIPFPQEVDALGMYTDQVDNEIVITVPKMNS